MSDQTEDSPDAEDDDDRHGIAPIVGAAAAGAVAGGLGSAALAGEVLATGEGAAAAATGLGPVGVPLGHSVAAGPAGVSIDAGSGSGPAGSSLGQGAAGPGGVSMASGAGVGPSGGPLTTFIRAHRLPFVVGAAVVATVGIGAIVVVAAHNDAPAAQPAAVAAAVEVTVAEAIPATVAVPSTDVPTTAVAVVPVDSAAETTTSAAAEVVTNPGAAACVVGSWVVDNQVFGYSFGAMSGGLGAINEITGQVLVDIAADGSVVTTYDNWVMRADLQGVPGVVSMTGADTNTIVFNDDGSYSVAATQIGSHMTATSGAITVIDGPSLQAVFQGSGTYTCAGDNLQMVIANSATPAIFTRTA